MTKKNLLYVDDEPINLQLFKFNFRQHYNLFLAQSAMEGLEILQKEEISIVISDFKMPEMNGLDFFTEIKKSKPHTPCILLSAYLETEIRDMSIDVGLVDCFIAKPWKREDVLGIISKYVEKV